MNDPSTPPVKKDSFDLDEVELHGDIQVERSGLIDEPKNHPKTFKGPMWVFLCLAIAACGGSIFFGLRYFQLKRDFQALQETKGQAQADLSATEGTLAELRQALTTSNEEGEKLSREVTRLKALVTELQTKNQALEREAARHEKTASQEKTRAKTSEAKAKDASNELQKTQRAFQAYRTEQETTVAELNAQIERQAELMQKLQEQDRGRQTELRKLMDEQTRLQTQLDEEGAASLRLIQERGRLNQSNQQLEKQNEQLRTDLEKARATITDLERIDIGELVPFSSRISPAIPTYQEPFPKDLRIPRRQGPIVVQMLISEVGAVENAFVVPGQSIDVEAARAIIDHVKKWKFSPPTLDGIRVKTWQPVLVQP